MAAWAIADRCDTEVFKDTCLRGPAVSFYMPLFEVIVDAFIFLQEADLEIRISISLLIVTRLVYHQALRGIHVHVFHTRLRMIVRERDRMDLE